MIALRPIIARSIIGFLAIWILSSPKISMAEDLQFLLTEPRSEPFTQAFLGKLRFIQTKYDRGVAKHIIAVSDLKVLDNLAKAAHDVPGSFNCGRLQLLTGRLTGLPILVTPPIHPTELALSGVKNVIEGISVDQISKHIKQMESFGTRFHSSVNGQAAVDKIMTMFSEAASGMLGVTIKKVSHSYTRQASLVVRIAGTEDGPLIVLGAHLDSINRLDISNAPGADDDATGVAALIEILRVLNQSQTTFRRPVELHAYGAEEIGLIGSGQIAKEYASQGTIIAAMLQMDMMGYSNSGDPPTIHIITTDTNKNLNYDLKNIIRNYDLGKIKFSTLAAGTSDHKSFYDAGFPTAFPFEDPEDMNPHYHKSTDLHANLNNLGLARSITKSALALTAHYAGLSGSSKEAQADDLFTTNQSGDITIAIWPKDDGYQLAAAMTSNAAYGLICERSKDLTPCNSTRLELQYVGQQGGRNVFHISGPISLSENQVFRLELFDTNHDLVAFRQFQLTEPEP